MCLLSEMVGGVSDWSPWLLAFRNESLIPLLIQSVDERLKVRILSRTQLILLLVTMVTDANR